ncbi:hypothetical protein DLM45_02355 [Hyphomicrobium methylovorum]|uniref:hypothetical protein n=1 Tax=Hyphomicrobium methylovorum TaxID=84 RepID=UPI0015E6A7D3|nr:hypothetical protein [Hyphomicrobium methylovorum]MBA2125068.1 hypothetical protein [Hyphomicrobium methylovorum]
MSLWQLFKAIPRGIAMLIVGIGAFLSAQWKQYTPFGQMLWVLALFAIAVDSGIAYEFGSTLSSLHAIGFGLVALAFCILPDVAAMEFRKGQKATAGWIGVACIPLGMVALLTHVGYSASIRVGDMQQSSVSNVKYEDTRAAVSDAEGKIKFFSDRIAALKDANPWITTVSADGLKAQAPALEEAIAQESRRGGCGPKCLGLKKELADVMERAGKAEELSKHESMLLAAQTGLDKARATAKATNYVSSTAVNHTDTLYKAVSLVGGQFVSSVTTDEREATNTGIMGASSIAFLLLAPMFYLCAGLNRRPGVLDEWIYGAKEEASYPYESFAETAGRSGAHLPTEAGSLPGVHSSVSITDERGISQLRKDMASHADRALALLQPRTSGAFA